MKTIWSITCKALGPRISDKDWESDCACLIRIFVFLVVGVAIVDNAWNIL